MRLSLAKIIISLLWVVAVSTSAADSWTVVQSTTVSNPLSLTQVSSNESVQSVNLINLDQSSGVAENTQQVLNASGNNVTLTITGGSNSFQAVNYLMASEVTKATQTTHNVAEVSLNQVNGSNHVQALNIVDAKGSVGTQIQSLIQTVVANTVTFDQNSGSGNIQAGNYIQADSISNTPQDVAQNFSVTTLNYSQSGSNNLQAGNVVIKNSVGSSGVVTQTFTADNVNANFVETNSGSGSIKAANYYAQKLN